MGANSAFAEESLLMETVKKLYGVPYKTGGTSKKGFDCSGFTRYVFNQLGVALPHNSASQYAFGQKVARKDLQPGDLLFFITNGRSISHVGIYIGNNTFVHSASGKGVVKTSLNDPYYWSKRFVGAKRLALPSLNTNVATGAQKKKPAVQAASVPETKKN
jgi:probable lipoprotein NlpC